MSSRNMHDDLGTFKDKRIGDVYEGGGAAGRALVEDVKEVSRSHALRGQSAVRTADTAKAIETVAKLGRCLEATKDAAKRREIEAMIAGLTAKYNLADVQKTQRPETKLATADAVKAGTTYDAQWLAQNRAQARDVANAIDAMIDTTIDNPTREELGQLSVRLRLQYGIPAEERGPGSLVFTQAQVDQTRLTDQRREQGRAMAAQLDGLADKTDDPILRETLRNMAIRTWGRFGRPTKGN